MWRGLVWEFGTGGEAGEVGKKRGGLALHLGRSMETVGSRRSNNRFAQGCVHASGLCEAYEHQPGDRRERRR